jgi:hypothetical protein
MNKDIKIKPKYLENYRYLIDEVIKLAHWEERNIETGIQTLWADDWLEMVLAEFEHLKFFAQQGKAYFAFGTKQTLLQSTYLMTDAKENLNSTMLGQRISEFQKIYDKVKDCF